MTGTYPLAALGNGISDMMVDEEKDKKTWAAFASCMKDVTDKIPAEKRQKTPLFLGATAGMRLLE